MLSPREVESRIPGAQHQIKDRTVVRPEKPIEELSDVGPAIFDLKKATQEVDEINAVQDRRRLSAATYKAEQAINQQEVLREQVKSSGGIGMSVETIWSSGKKEIASRPSVDEEMRQYHSVTARREETVATLTDRLRNLQARKSELHFWDLKMKGVLNQEIFQTQEALKLKQKESVQKETVETTRKEPTINEQLLAKEYELSNLSRLNPFQWSRRSKLEAEIRLLKGQVAREKIADALFLKKKE